MLGTSYECPHTSQDKEIVYPRRCHVVKSLNKQDKEIVYLRRCHVVKSLNEQRKRNKQSPIQTAFLNIRKQNDESFVKSERILRNFMTAELKISKEEANDISSESVCRIG